MFLEKERLVNAVKVARGVVEKYTPKIFYWAGISGTAVSNMLFGNPVSAQESSMGFTIKCMFDPPRPVMNIEYIRAPHHMAVLEINSLDGQFGVRQLYDEPLTLVDGELRNVPMKVDPILLNPGERYQYLLIDVTNFDLFSKRATLGLQLDHGQFRADLCGPSSAPQNLAERFLSKAA